MGAGIVKVYNGSPTIPPGTPTRDCDGFLKAPIDFVVTPFLEENKPRTGVVVTNGDITAVYAPTEEAETTLEQSFESLSPLKVAPTETWDLLTILDTYNEQSMRVHHPVHGDTTLKQLMQKANNATTPSRLANTIQNRLRMNDQPILEVPDASMVNGPSQFTLGFYTKCPQFLNIRPEHGDLRRIVSAISNSLDRSQQRHKTKP